MVYCKNCIDGINELDDNSIQCIVTSPPYNKGFTRETNTSGRTRNWTGFAIKYDVYNDNRPQDEYENEMIGIFSSLYRVAKEGGSMFINHKTILKNKSAHFPKWIFDIRDWNLYQIITWDRRCTTNIRKEVFFPMSELIFWFTKGKNPKTHKDRCEFKNDIWPFQAERNTSHPAPFPLKLPLNCIKMTTDPGDIVLDPFAGSGTTGVSAKMCDCEFIGYELSQAYVDMANKRIDETCIPNSGQIASLKHSREN